VIIIYTLETLPSIKKELTQIPQNVKSLLEIVELKNNADERL
jgi:hypothetical protein